MIVQHFNCPIICYDIFCSVKFFNYFVHSTRLLSSFFFCRIFSTTIILEKNIRFVLQFRVYVCLIIIQLIYEPAKSGNTHYRILQWLIPLFIPNNNRYRHGENIDVTCCRASDCMPKKCKSRIAYSFPICTCDLLKRPVWIACRL